MPHIHRSFLSLFKFLFPPARSLLQFSTVSEFSRRAVAVSVAYERNGREKLIFLSSRSKKESTRLFFLEEIEII
jgi:hypothetical protein